MIQAFFEPHFSSFRCEARRLLEFNTPPEQVLWPDKHAPSLFLFHSQEGPAPHVEVLPATKVFTVPKEFFKLAKFVSCSRNPERWALLYRILYRLKNETSDLLKIFADEDIHKANLLMKSVTRDIHKMHAFVRFKYVVQNGQEIYMAWHRPEHLIVEEAAPFFQRRFGDKPWCIMTPDRSVYWDLQELHFGSGLPQNLFKFKDDFDELWKTYYSSIFNPARLKIKAMKTEMAQKYWSTLPEAELIPQLIRDAPARLQKMAKNQNTQAEVPKVASLSQLQTANKNCKACPLYKEATQTVGGEGSVSAQLMIVGEQPGDQEDLGGKPFIGPAGQILNLQLQNANLDREKIYLTNAVKHFKFQHVGKLRKHSKASGAEMHACRPWLEAEINFIKPKVIVALGLTAATSILGRLPKMSQERGQIIRESPYAEVVIISWHPAAILRDIDPVEAETKKLQLGKDLQLAASCLRG